MNGTRADREAEAGSERHALALAAGGIGSFEWFPDEGRLEVSDEYRRLWGLPADLPITDALLVSLLEVEDRALSGPARLDGSGNPLAYAEYRVRRFDTKEVRWLARRGERIADSSGGPARYVGVAYDITERKAMEQALQVSDARMREAHAYTRLLLDSTEEAFYSVDRTGLTTLCNAAFLRMLGYRDESEVLGRALHPVIHHSHPDGSPYDRGDCPIYRTAQTGEPAHVDDELFFRTDGTSFPVEYRAHPIYRDGELQGAICTFVDITERRRSAARLRETELRLRLALDAAAIGVWEVDVATGRLSWDERIREVSEVTVETPDWERDFLAVIHPEDRPALLTAFADALNGGDGAEVVVDYRVIGRETGRTTWAAIQGRRTTGVDGGARIIGVARDVTAEREASDTLERRVAEAVAERQLWADMFEGVEDPIAAVSPSLHILALNKAYADTCERLFQVRFQVGDSLEEKLAHMPEARDAAAGLWRRAIEGESFELTEMGDQDDSGRYYDVAFLPLTNREGERIGAFQYSREVTRRVQAQARLRDTEEALRQAHKMEAVGQLTGGIAHDFNNLLQGILDSLNLIQKRVAEGRTGDLDRFITGAATSANRAAALTHRLLAFSRRQPLDPRPVRANALVASMEDLLRRTMGERITLDLVLADDLWPTLCDSNQLESALLNLVINARDAMPDGGRLVVETHNARLDAAYALTEQEVRPGAYVCLSVSDTGMGMAAEVIERAFDPFFTTKPIGQGTGLGLSMIYGFARQSEGHAKIYSQPGQGTTVKLYLPRHRGEAEAEDAPPAPGRDRQAEDGEVVLVVEDDAVVRGLIVEVLRELGYRALEASDGASGLALLQEDRRIDLLVTDIGLPGLNGRQVADAARVRRPGLRVLFMTGYAQNAALANGFLEPGMAMLTKPFALDALSERIRDMIEAP